MEGHSIPPTSRILTKTHKHTHVSAAITNIEASAKLPPFAFQTEEFARLIKPLLVSNVYDCLETKMGFPECSCYW